MVFKSSSRKDEKVGATIWQGKFTDYGRVEWSKVKTKMHKNPMAGMKAQKQFDNT